MCDSTTWMAVTCFSLVAIFVLVIAWALIRFIEVERKITLLRAKQGLYQKRDSFTATDEEADRNATRARPPMPTRTRR